MILHALVIKMTGIYQEDKEMSVFSSSYDLLFLALPASLIASTLYVTPGSIMNVE